MFRAKPGPCHCYFQGRIHTLSYQWEMLGFQFFFFSSISHFFSVTRFLHKVSCLAFNLQKARSSAEKNPVVPAFASQDVVTLVSVWCGSNVCDGKLECSYGDDELKISRDKNIEFHLTLFQRPFFPRKMTNRVFLEHGLECDWKQMNRIQRRFDSSIRDGDVERGCSPFWVQAAFVSSVAFTCCNSPTLKVEILYGSSSSYLRVGGALSGCACAWVFSPVGAIMCCCCCCCCCLVGRIFSYSLLSALRLRASFHAQYTSAPSTRIRHATPSEMATISPANTEKTSEINFLFSNLTHMCPRNSCVWVSCWGWNTRVCSVTGIRSASYAQCILFLRA